MTNELTKDIALADGKACYDAYCKRILANKPILTWILKFTVSEFAEMTFSQIRNCIDGDPEISSERIEPGYTNSRITGEMNEDKIPDEGAVFFDIRFSVRIGEIRRQIKLIINIEAQKDFYPGYDIVTRGIFYGSRLISSQLGTEFSCSHYDDIKKVYSIWICMNAPAAIGNAISKYSIKKTDYVSGIPDRVKGYDKLSVIIICLNETSENQSQLTAMLNTLLSSRLPVKEKIQNLENKFQIKVNNDLGKELNQMCNLSDLVEERGMEKGKSLMIITMIQKKCQKNKTLEETAAELEENADEIRDIYWLVRKYPEESSESIFRRWRGEN